jgi:hypothetical protein
MYNQDSIPPEHSSGSERPDNTWDGQRSTASITYLLSIEYALNLMNDEGPAPLIFDGEVKE